MKIFNLFINLFIFESFQCPVTCGEGVQERSAYCINTSNGNILHESRCDGLPIPNTQQACNLGTCPAVDDSNSPDEGNSRYDFAWADKTLKSLSFKSNSSYVKLRMRSTFKTICSMCGIGSKWVGVKQLCLMKGRHPLRYMAQPDNYQTTHDVNLK